MRALLPLLLVLGASAIGACAPTGDGCPFGGCTDDGSRKAHAQPTLAPRVDPFVEGGHYRASPYNAFLVGDQLLYRDDVCEYEAMTAADGSASAVEGWRAPPTSLQRIYRVTRVGQGCHNLSAGDLLRVVAVGESQLVGSNLGEQLWLGPVSANRPFRILSRN
jgi:hypothetical protein